MLAKSWQNYLTQHRDARSKVMILVPNRESGCNGTFLGYPDILPWSESLGFAFMLQHWQRMVASSCICCNRLAQLTCMYWKARRPVESGHQVRANLASWWCKDAWYLNQSFVILCHLQVCFPMVSYWWTSSCTSWYGKIPFLLRLHIFQTSAEFFINPIDHGTIELCPC